MAWVVDPTAVCSAPEPGARLTRGVVSRVRSVCSLERCPPGLMHRQQRSWERDQAREL